MSEAENFAKISRQKRREKRNFRAKFTLLGRGAHVCLCRPSPLPSTSSAAQADPPREEHRGRSSRRPSPKQQLMEQTAATRNWQQPLRISLGYFFGDLFGTPNPTYHFCPEPITDLICFRFLSVATPAEPRGEKTTFFFVQILGGEKF